jgi:hypothetical protein
MRSLLIAALVSSVATGVAVSPALADANAADSCARSLPTKSRLIFDSVLPRLGRNVPGNEVMSRETNNLVQAGKIQRGESEPAAKEAARCLNMLYR